MPASNVSCSVGISHQGIDIDPQELSRLARIHDRLSLTFRIPDQQTADFLFVKQRIVSPSLYKNLSSNSSHVEDLDCHFEGGTRDIHYSLSACSPEQSVFFFISHLNWLSLIVRDGQFLLLPHGSSQCAFFDEKRSLVSKRRSKRAAKTVEQPAYIDELMDGRWRFVELAMIADWSMYTKFKNDETALNLHMASIVNVMNQLYKPLKIRLELVYTEIWKEGDKLTVVGDASATLAEFMTFRKTILRDHPHDNAQLLTDFKFTDGVVGKAYKGTMCSYDYSGGVCMDHSDILPIVAATIAHEMGHNFGMDHDVDAKICECPVDSCIMSPAAGHHLFWSQCSVKFLSSGIDRGIDICLQNDPGTKPGDAKCGNGIIDLGEECDCGSATCSNKCCDGKTCKLIGEAECASGECCDVDTCKVKPRATVCRSSTGICDLEEFCNGETADCPADFFVQNGQPCPERQNEYCYEGVCGSRPDQCVKLWGDSGKPADNECYRMNVFGKMYGNCGYDVHTQIFTPCKPEDKMCGLLHCETNAERPVYGTSSAIQFMHVPIDVGKDKKYCYVVKSTYVGAKKVDPGMVPDGTYCGNDSVCVGAKCKPRNDVLKLTAHCDNNCHDRGICNNVGNCHCERGFGGTACEIPGYGGSVNSNQAYQFRGITLSTTFLFLFIIFGFAIIGVCVYYRYKRKRNLISEFWKFMKKTFNLHGEMIPVRKAPPPPGGRRHMKRSSLNAMWGDENPSPVPNPANYNSCPKPPLFNPPAIPMVSIQPLSSPTPLLHNHGIPAEVYNPVTMDNNQKVTVSRTGSLRPKEQPPGLPHRPKPEVLEKLYEEHGAEIGVKKPKSQFDRPLPEPPEEERKVSLRRNESLNRPGAAPPPPPPAISKPKIATKPTVPAKPPKMMKEENSSEEAKIDVKSMAARFDAQKKTST